MVQIALAVLLYPGLALTLALAVLAGWLATGRSPFAGMRGGAPWRGLDGVVATLSILLAALGLALLPWPYHPAAGQPWIGSPPLIWAAFEGAFLLPILPGLLAPTLGARAAAREAQISLAGRCVVWLSLGAALWSGAGWAASDAPGRLLAGLAGLLALPAALGAGPFRAESSLSAAGAEEGLDEATTPLVRFARVARGAALLAALVVASIPPSVGLASPAATLQLGPPIALLLIAALFLVIVLAMRQVSAALPRLTLPAALRWCWWRVLPIAIMGLVYLAIV
jgi:hypothetical protein